MEAFRVAPVAPEDGNINGPEVWDLPQSHLFREVWGYDRGDWNAVSARLMTPEGVLEARQWVCVEDWGQKLFLHYVCAKVADLESDGEAREQSLRAAIQAIEAYPDALHIPDCDGLYPLHFLCENVGFHDSWKDTATATARELFKRVLFGNPEAAKLQAGADQRTALHYVASSGHPEAFEMLMGMFPDAIKFRDKDGALPLHLACRDRVQLACRDQVLNNVKTLLDAHPVAIQLLSESRSCLQESLRYLDVPSDYDVVRFLIKACPRMLANDDGKESRIIENSHFLSPVGDALDYICHNYCESLGMDMWFSQGHPDAPYFRWNVAFVDGRHRGEQVYPARLVAATFDMVIIILREMYGRINGNSTLHAAVHGSLCRPWNLVVFKEVVARFGHEAQELDSDGNLPLHLFLKSCMIEHDRSIERRFVDNGEEYEEAVARSLRMLLAAHSDAAATTNGDGRLPLHLAIDHRSLSFQTAIAPLLDLSPHALRTRDTKTGLYPFMSAAVGASANADMTYRLLRHDPTVLLQSGYLADNSRESRKRERE